MKPQIVTDFRGWHEQRLGERLEKDSYKDRTMVVFTPTIGLVHAKVVQSREGLMPPMNSRFYRVWLIGLEVGKAYETMVEILRNTPDLQKCKYVLTLEDDNTLPPDGVIKLCEDMENHPEYDAIGALYYLKGEGGKPMAYGRPQDTPKNFVPWLPPPNTVAEVNGLGMGATIFRTKMFLDEKFTRPIFQTLQEYTPGVGGRAYTQDLLFFENAAKLGYRFACTTNVISGHVDRETGEVW